MCTTEQSYIPSRIAALTFCTILHTLLHYMHFAPSFPYHHFHIKPTQIFIATNDCEWLYYGTYGTKGAADALPADIA